MFEPRVIIVKCFKLKRLLGMCRVFPSDCVQGATPFTGHWHDELPPDLGRPPMPALEGSIREAIDAREGTEAGEAARDGVPGCSNASADPGVVPPHL